MALFAALISPQFLAEIPPSRYVSAALPLLHGGGARRLRRRGRGKPVDRFCD